MKKLTQTNTRSLRTVKRLVPAVLLALLFDPMLAGSQPALNEHAQAEIRALLAEKASWTGPQRKMESHLIQATKRHRGQAFAPGAPNLKLQLKTESDGRILVDIDAKVTEGLLVRIKKDGGAVIGSFPEFHAIRALVTLEQLETLAGANDVKFIRQAARAMTNTGSITSQGDVTHRADYARTAFGVSGQGVKVGVLSDSIDFLTSSQATGDLGDVTILPGQGGTGNGEGTAMLEIIHDLAPGAQLYFATAVNGQASFAQNILDLRSNGCQVIIDDVYYFAEPVFQDGIIARAVNSVTADGALYFSAAGNDGNLKDGTSGTWEGDFVDGGAAVGDIDIGGGRVHSFGTLNFNTVLAGGYGVDLFWADPLGASTNDYDLFLLDPSGNSVIASSLNLQNGTQDPYETLPFFPDAGDQIVILKTSGAGRFLHLVTSRGLLSVSTSGATRGHSAVAAAFDVAAVNVADSYPLPFSGGGANPVETFSSDGPRRVFFNPDGSPITPGDFSSSGGTVLQKPDITAADGVATSLYYFDPFFGTSAAAPHAGAIAALLLSYDATLTPAQVRNLLTSTALDIEGPGPDSNSGAGIVMAERALQPLPSKPILMAGGTAFVAESCLDGVLDPGERVTISFTLSNVGTANTTNLVATLLASGGITSPTGSQNYGALAAGGGNTSRSFSFTASGSCGDTNIATLQLQDGATDLGIVSFPLPMGKTRVALAEAFDSAVAPALPAGWTVSWSGAGAAWSTTTATSDTPPNSVFAPDPYGTSDNSLISPVIHILTPAAKLTFRHSISTYNYYYDGGVLEISTNGGPFIDILSAGGTFVTNGYFGTLYSGYGNPLGSRQAWTGYSGGFIRTVVNLPASAAGQNVQLRWRFGSSSFYGQNGGWYIDTVSITDGFDCCVPVANDIAVGITDSPDPALVGGSITYTITVLNTGPSTATGVTVLDVLPPSFTLQSLIVSPPASLSGHGTSGGGTMSFNLGSMPGGTSINITLIGSLGAPGLITNQVTVTRGEADANPTNNTARAVTMVTLPSLSISGVSVIEGNSGTTNANFLVRLSAPINLPVLVNYATATSNQTAVVGSDYVAASGTLLFAPGVTNQTIPVAVIGDTLNEPSETFLVTLSSPSNAVLATSQAVGTIINDDPLPNVSISDATVLQPDSGTTNAVFTVSLSTASGQSVSVSYFTSNGTANASIDYIPVFTTQLTFNPGETNKTVGVAVKDHTTVRPQQTFYVALAYPNYAKIDRSIGLGTIITAMPGRADHFLWSAISSPQPLGGPIAATITAQDYWNNLATDFDGSVALSGGTNGFGSGTLEDFESGVWPHAPWVALTGAVGSISPAFAHDGSYGLRDPEWMYRTDVQLGNAGDSLSWWIRPDYSYYGRAYLGFGASAGGCWSVVAAPNSGEFILQQNPNYDFSYVATTNQAWQSGKWYKVEVQFVSTSAVVCNLYDSDGTTLLNSLRYGGVTGLPGGVAMRSFDSVSLDTISTNGSGSIGIAIAPTHTGSFSNGVWQGHITVAQPAANMTLRADDGHGHTGLSNPFDVQPVAGQVTSFAWNPIASPQTSGVPFAVTVIAQDFFRTTATNFNGTVMLDAAGSKVSTNTILPAPSYLYANSGFYTLGYAFTPNTNMTVTHVRHYFGTKVSIWTDAGVLIASRSVSSVPGTWVETPLTAPIQLTAGVRYRVGVYTGGGNYYYRTDMNPGFPNGTINQAYEASGDAFPGITDYLQWAFVDLKYTTSVPMTVPVGVTPAISANFTNGVWKGSVAIGRSATSAILTADDGSGHVGLSNPFDVVPGRGQVDHFVWGPITSPQVVGEPFAVTLTAQDYYNAIASNFTGTVTVSGKSSGGMTTNTLLPSTNYLYVSSGYYTMGYAFTPSTNLTVTHVRHYFGTKVSIWTDAGVLLASQNVTSVPGTWVETPLSTPIQLTAGTRYRVAAYTGGGNYYYRYDLAAAFPYGTINQGYEASGDAFPNFTDSVQWWFVDLKYTVGSPPTPTSITPNVAGNFVNGVWSGSMTVLQGATNLVLQADDGQGHIGSSNPFNVAPRGQVDHFAWATIGSPQFSGAPFGSVITALDYFNNTATNFNGTVALSASGSIPSTNTILPSPSHQYTSSGTYTLGYAFTPNTNMTVTHVRHYFGTKVSIWTDAGALLASRTVTSVPGTWVETPLVSPVQLIAGRTYRVAAYAGAGTFYYRYDMPFAFPYGSINQGYEAFGDVFPNGGDSLQWSLVDLKYTVATPAPLVISPTNSGSFINGVWSGNIVVPYVGQPLSNVVVRADDGNGHTGSSSPFAVVPAPGQIDHLVWSPIAASQAVGEQFGVTVTAQDYYNTVATNFTGPVTLSGQSGSGITTNSILSSPSYQYYSSGYYTMGYAFTPSTNMTVTHVRHYFGTKVSIWTDAGVLLASQSVISLPGTWVETPLSTPVQLTAGTRYRVAAYTGGGNYYYRSDLSAAFPYGTINQGYQASGDGFPGSSDSVQWWLVDLKYTVGSPLAPLAISPTISGNFINGVWSGNVTVLQGATNVMLQADDGQGHVGSSNPFNVAPRGQVDHFVWGSIGSPQLSGVPFGASITAQDYFNSTVSNYNGAVALSALGSIPSTNTILGSPSYQYFSSGSYTMGYAFTPNTNITVTHVRHYFGTKVSIWTDAGVLLASRTYSSTAGTWIETPLTTPVQLTAGQRYRVGVYTGGGNYYYRYDLGQSFSNGTINQGFEASGDSFPSFSDSYYWMLVDLKYTVAIPIPMALSPTNGGSFTNGVWSGNLAVSQLSQPVSNVVVKADDGYGHTGSSSPFAVVPAPGQIDHLVWNSIPAPQTIGQPFGVTVTAQDYYNSTATAFVGTVMLSGTWPQPVTTNNILQSPSYLYSGSGTYTLGYAFTPGTNVTVTHVRHFFGTKVSIWTDAGILMGSRTVTSVPGTWVETPLNLPIQLKAGTRYRVGVYTAGGNYFYRTDMGAAFPYGTINQGYEASGDAFPNSADSLQWAFVDLKYTVSAPAPLPVAPTVSGNFSNGVWSGSMTVSQGATNLVLLADDGSGHTGSSSPFNVIPALQPPSIAVQPGQRVVCVGSLALMNVVVSGTPPLSFQWSKDGTPIAGATDARYWILSAQPSDGGRYSVTVTNVSGTAMSSNATLTVASRGSIVAWGDNSAGQSSVPSGLIDAVAVAGGYAHTLALRQGGTVVAWGDNSSGQTNPPPGLSNVVAIAAGYYHNLALLRDGTVAAWGDNTDGQTSVPPGLNNVVAIAGGGFHSLALRNNGTVVAWGYNGFGETNPPANLNNVVAVAGGAFHSLALRRDGTVVAWGNNSDGQTNVPVGASGVVSVAGGRFHSSVAMSDGTVSAWGYNGSGQAAAPNGLSNVVAVACGADQSLALGRDGTVTAWGYNLYGQAAVPPGLSNVAAIAGGYSHSLALVAYDPPMLLSQPQDLTVAYGANASFAVSFGGATPLSFQWQKNVTDLSNAYGATLTLNNVTRADEANYRVIVTNIFGSIISSNAGLRVLVPQQITMASMDSGGVFHLGFADAYGSGLADPENILVLATTNLLPTNTEWVALTNGRIIVTNGILQFDDLGSRKLSQRFYRVIEQ